MKSKIISSGQLSLKPDDPAAHFAKDVEVAVIDHGLGITGGTPEKNQQGLIMDALGEAGRLLSKDAESEVLLPSWFFRLKPSAICIWLSFRIVRTMTSASCYCPLRKEALRRI